MLICISFTISQLAYEETEAYNWPIAMFEVAYSQVYSIHITSDTGPGIFPKSAVMLDHLEACSPARPCQMNFRSRTAIHSLARPASTKVQVACEHL